MAHSKRMSFSSTRSESPLVLTSPFNIESLESEEWIKAWEGVYARDLIDSRVVSLDAETSVEEACDILLSEGILCLAVKSRVPDSIHQQYLGLFDFSDVNAFLTLAATRHTFLAEDLRENPRVDQIVTAARAGRVPVHLVSNLSEKNPLETLPNDANLMSLLSLFSRGMHRVLIQSSSPSEDYIGIVSDRRLLAWFSSHAQTNPPFLNFLSNPLNSLSLPSLNIYSSVISTTSTSTVLDAMKLMSDQGVSSVAVIDESRGSLLSAVSVTDIGKIVVPSQSNQILSTPLHQFVSYIKAPDGSTDGADKYPVYSVLPSSTLSYTIEKLLATNAHRLFVTKDPSGSGSTLSSSSSPNLSGIVSTVDILSLFARVGNIPDVDPHNLTRHRRASSSSSHSSRSERELARSRSGSRTSIKQSPRASVASPASGGGGENPRSSISSVDSLKWAERVPK